MNDCVSRGVSGREIKYVTESDLIIVKSTSNENFFYAFHVRN